MTQHTICKGETLSSIAKRYAVSSRELAAANHITDPRHLRTGQILTIPSHREKNGSHKKPETRKESPAVTEREIIAQFEEVLEKGFHLSHLLLEELLQRLRWTEAEEHIQHKEKIPVQNSKSATPNFHPEPAKKSGSRGKQKIAEVKQKLKEQLNKEAHIVTFKGVRLTQNEKKQIVAAVACCEMNSDGFGSLNEDYEFVGRKFGKRGIETGYSRIVHIGLSYGVIQYTQDSGTLGLVLRKMYERNSQKFIEIFGGGDKGIAENLIELTTDGRPDLRNTNSIPMSGQEYWNKIRKTPSGTELLRLASKENDGGKKSGLPQDKEIRGKRVQPISAKKGDLPSDIWTGLWKQRFLDAGKEIDFQDTQLEVAVERYLDPILSIAKQNGVRSALGIAFIVACSIRGGPNSQLPKLLFRVAEEIGIHTPFENSERERECIQKLADSKGSIGKLHFDQDESRRAKLLLADELGFLAEDLYDLSTY